MPRFDRKNPGSMCIHADPRDYQWHAIPERAGYFWRIPLWTSAEVSESTAMSIKKSRDLCTRDRKW